MDGLVLNEDSKELMDFLNRTSAGMKNKKKSFFNDIVLNKIKGNNDYQFVDGKLKIGDGYIGGSISNDNFNGIVPKKIVAGSRINDKLSIDSFYEPDGSMYGGKKLGAQFNYKF